ncbi:hypothetical protein ACIRUY_35395 [Streptomyces erythrochromogenes]|uniref:hypothetical protein n=1 Tax=Streptomyces erythrochromogenes TaxID=285574 RepID=UPI00381E854B
MGRRDTRYANGARQGRAGSAGPLAQDTHWAGERNAAIGAAFLLFIALCALDACAGRLGLTRGALWAGLAVLLFVVLLPPRVSTRPGELSTRGLLVERSVRTDALVSVRWSDGVSERMTLRDTDGNRVEIDPAVLVRNPAMWQRVDTDTRTSIQRGTLRYGATALRRLAARIDRETARTVFKVSGVR